MTAAQYGVPCVNLVWEDGSCGLIEWNQQLHFGRSPHARFRNPDLVNLAAAFGARAFRVESAGDFTDTVREAFAEKEKPGVVVVPVDCSESRELTERLGKLLNH